ncbi:MAG: hypothetical protein Q9226_000795 [Calogaya cf. arnoldii]
MPLTTQDDPFAPSLPTMDSPDMGSLLIGPTENFFGDQYNGSFANQFDSPKAAHAFPNAASTLGAGYDSSMNIFDTAADNSQSSESSPTSSSRSSIQNIRHESSNSSRSATATWALNDDRQMRQFFDFDSATNSPGGPRSTQESSDLPIRGMAIPQHEPSPQQIERQLVRPNSFALPLSHSPVSTPSSFKLENPVQHRHVQSRSFEFKGPVGFSHDYLQNQPYGKTAGSQVANAGFVGPVPFDYPPHSVMPPRAAMHGPVQSEQTMAPILTIETISSKTRVETQIPIKVTLNPLPLGITKLHLPPRTMAKSKLMAKDPPDLSFDMLELEVMPVCASAMRNPVACRRAFALARGEPLPRPQKQRSSSEGPPNHADAPAKIDPRDGGPISICDGCIVRERKRANRRTVKKEKTEEDVKWEKREKERIVVFNETEVVEWKPFGSINLAGKRGKGGGKDKERGDSGEEAHMPTFAPGSGMPYGNRAKQVRLQMRITCYCRHQGETEGFQVIYTLKNHVGSCVAQGICDPILITDDHKTSPAQIEGPAPGLIDRSHLPSGPYWSAAPANNPGAGQHFFNINASQSHSTTELSSHSFHHNHPPPHRASTTLSLQQYSRLATARSTGVSTPLKNSSYGTSTTITPPRSSRGVSPSATSGPAPKRRKASGSFHPNLSMTKMQTTDHQHRPSRSSSSSSDASEGLTMAPATSAAPAASAAHSSTPSRSSPSTTQPQSPHPIQPFIDVNIDPYAQARHAQLLRDSLLGAMAPTVLGTIPKEGPVAGGIEVCIRGEGFIPGLEVLFGDSLASRTVVDSTQVLFCTLPPAPRFGPVEVTLRGRPHPVQPVWFYYHDDQETIMRTALEFFSCLIPSMNAAQRAPIRTSGSDIQSNNRFSESHIQSDTGSSESHIPGNTRSAESPPSYEESCPPPSPSDLKTASVNQALNDTIMDRKCAAVLNTLAPSAAEESIRPAVIRAMAKGTTEQEHEELRRVHAMTVKKLSNDRKLFLIWIPILIIVILAMCWDWAPMIRKGVSGITAFVQGRVQAA